MKNFTNYSLDELSTSLRNVIQQLNDEEYADVKSSVKLSLLHIDTYNERLVIPMKELCRNLLVSVYLCCYDINCNDLSKIRVSTLRFRLFEIQR